MSAHIYDFITDRMSRAAIERREYGAGGGDCAPFLNEARKEGASGCMLPSGWIPIASSVTLDNFELVGEFGNAGALWPYATHGSVIEIRSPTIKPFLLGENWGLSRLAIFHPLQMPKAGGPDVYEPVLQPISTTTNVTGGVMDRCSVINAYILASLGGNEIYAKAGQNSFINSRLCALKDLFVLNHMPDWLDLTGSQCGWNLFGDPMAGYGGAPFDAGWRDWVTANSVAFRIKGNGAGQSVDGPVLTPAVYYGFKQVFLVEAGATLTNLTAEGIMADACQQLLRVDPGGGIVASTITLGGGCYQQRKAYESAACAPFVDVDNPSACSGLTVHGYVPETKGSLVRIRGANVASYDVRLGTDGFARTTTAGEYWAADVDCPNARAQRLDIACVTDAPVSGTVIRSGVRVASGQASSLQVMLNGLQTPVSLPATGLHAIRGVIAGTGGAQSLVATSLSNINVSGLKADKPWAMDASVATAAPVALTGSDAPLTLLSLPLDAGDWDLTAPMEFSGDANTTVGYLLASISSTAGTLSTLPARRGLLYCFGATVFGGVGALSVRAGPARFSLASPATLYLVVQGGYGVGALKANGSLIARRVIN